MTPNAAREILIVTTGGTIDRRSIETTAADKQTDYQFGPTIVDKLLTDARVTHPYRLCKLLQKDSLYMDDADRLAIREAIAPAPNELVVVTHGTDTMTATAARLNDIGGKTIVLTGAFSPARCATTDAMFNVGMAIAAVQVLSHGVYIVMNGVVFPEGTVIKNKKAKQFERKS